MNKTNKGGYQILDLGNIDLTGSPTIEGLYELIEGTKKPVRLTRINLGGVEKHDVVSMPVVSGSDYVFENIYGYDLSIDSDGNLSLASTKWATKAEIEGGTLDNTKPIYCHPLEIYRANTLLVSALVFNNSDELINTWAKLKAAIASFGGTNYNRLLVSGAMVDNGDTIIVNEIIHVVASDTYKIVGVKTDGTIITEGSGIDITSLALTVGDDLNKIN